MQRVLIIGKPASGKSTLAARLAPLLGLPLIHLDQHFWNPGWVETPRELWRPKAQELVDGGCWIIDGNYGSSLEMRLPRADTVIFLDFPTPVCLWRVAKRMIGNYGRTREDMAPGCPERVDLAVPEIHSQF